MITGASRGIGKATALLFAKEGAKVIVNCKTEETKAKKVVDKIKKLGSDAIVVKCDVSKENEVKDMIDCAIKKYGKVDILVNNAGIVYDLPLFKKTVEQWRETLNVNLIGVFLCSKYVSKYMKKQKLGTIINISSTNGVHTLYPESADYDASKAGIINLTRNLSMELGPKIRVNCIAPGWVNTDFNKDLPKEFVREEEKKIIMKRFAEPEEIASVALFLASNESRYITGTTIIADGGM